MKKVLIDNIKISIDEFNKKYEIALLNEKIKKTINTSAFHFIEINRKSLDARRKNALHYQYRVLVDVDDDFNEEIMKNVVPYQSYQYEKLQQGNVIIKKRPIIIGAGPSGLFCAYLLAKYGFQPIVLERGERVDQRMKKVYDFWRGHPLDEESNVQFGEGGAGTFSDGKLVTRINDSRTHYVFSLFHQFGAEKRIFYQSKPHIGSDALCKIVENMRNEIIRLGGSFQFSTCVTDVLLKKDRINGVKTNQRDELASSVVVLAMGHSARDFFDMLNKNHIQIEQKPFSMGLRIEHPQQLIDRSQYGKSHQKVLEKAEYSIFTKTNDRTIYSFCMCPGGRVINASSEQKHLVTNGMSYAKRNLENANSAWVVNVSKKDFPNDHPLAGMLLQRSVESKTYRAGGNINTAPIQRLDDFINNIKTTKLGTVKPSFTGDTRFADLNQILPEYISHHLKVSLKDFSKKMEFFSLKDAILTGSETRTSSPLRICRNDDFEANQIHGLYPCGEGSGYAGGITSSAVDGLRVAEAIIKKYQLGG